MKNIIPSLILSLALLGCDSALRLGSDGSGENAERTTGEVCYSNARICFTRLSSTGLDDPKNDFQYFDNDRGPQYRKPSHFIDLREMDLTKRISDNFFAIDYVSAAKGPYAILSRLLVDSIQAIRDELNKPIIINSGYRSPGYNSAINGAARFSRHTFGDAVDFKANGASLERLQELCEDFGASFTLVYSTHVHCDWRQSPLDHSFFPKNLDPTRVVPLPYHEITKGRISFKIYQNQIRLYVEDFFVEEPGDFVYEWSVITPRGEEIQSDRSTITLNPESGTYNISVRVGNSVQLNEILEW